MLLSTKADFCRTVQRWLLGALDWLAFEMYRFSQRAQQGTPRIKFE
jgi:hypothetical protein